MATGALMHCAASGCMAWRWTKGATNVNTDTGFCGMAPATVH
jgi:hypothetical protein